MEASHINFKYSQSNYNFQCIYDNESVEIPSNNQGALQTVKFDSEAVLSCHQKLQQVAEHPRITLRLVPSNCEIT